MQFLYHPDAGREQITLDGDNCRYICKVRRHRIHDTIALRNLKESSIHLYTLESIERKTALLRIIESKELPIEPRRKLHIGWCIIDPKKIEKTLPSLNELGVSKITFIHCDRSQSNFKIDTKRIETILLNSSQQCGRSQMMEIDFAKNISKFVDNNPNSIMINFTENKLVSKPDIGTVIIGCEGGFSEKEVGLLSPNKILGLDSPMILRSENATMAVAAWLLL